MGYSNLSFQKQKLNNHICNLVKEAPSNPTLQVHTFLKDQGMHLGYNTPSLLRKGQHKPVFRMFCPKRAQSKNLSRSHLVFPKGFIKQESPSLQLLANVILCVLESSHYPKEANPCLPCLEFW